MDKTSLNIQKTEYMNIRIKPRTINPKYFQLSEHHLVFLSDLPWDTFPKRPHNLCLNLAENYKIIKALVKLKIPVMGHIGFTPQYKKKFKIEGKNKIEEKKLIKESLLIENAGAFSIVLECITPNVAKEITKLLKIPTIGIGSSAYCDGQILVTDDILGLSGFYPKFVKKYANLNTIIEKVIKKYSKEVKTKVFPNNKNFLYGQ